MVTGAAGYIGSHAALALLDRGDRVVALDNLSRGNRGAIEVLAREGGDRFRFEQVDLLDRDELERLLRASGADTVMHFAALALVGESVKLPRDYWRNNTLGTIHLRDAMAAAGIRRIVFSSTAATYGVPAASENPIRESCRQRPINPYGRSKLACESLLLDELASPEGSLLEVAILRYFNVAGGDAKARLGEDHRPETHLVPVCLDVALGESSTIEIFGDRHGTPDGTCVRDYVHVNDLVDAHLLAMERMRAGEAFVANVGIGRGFSVREVLESCRRVTGHAIPERLGPPRDGDPPTLVADASHLRATTGWSARFTELDEIVSSAWLWKQRHPRGYAGASTTAPNSIQAPAIRH